MSGAADDAEAGGEEGAGGAGQAAYAKSRALMHDDAGAKKANAGEDALDDPAGCIGDLGRFGELEREQNHGRQWRSPTMPSVFSAPMACRADRGEPDRSGGDSRGTETSKNFGPVRLRHFLGRRPIR